MPAAPIRTTIWIPARSVRSGCSDGRTLVSASADHTLTQWNLEGEILRRFHGHTDKVLDVALSPDGRTALSGSRDQTLILWNLARGTAIHQLSGKGCPSLYANGMCTKRAFVSGRNGRKMGLNWALIYDMMYPSCPDKRDR